MLLTTCMKRTLVLALALVLLGQGVAAQGTGSVTNVAPTIDAVASVQNLTTTGGVINFTGEVEDRNKPTDLVNITLTTPSGSVIVLDAQNHTNATNRVYDPNVADANYSFAFHLNPGFPGIYTLTVHDESDNATLSINVTGVAPPPPPPNSGGGGGSRSPPPPTETTPVKPKPFNPATDKRPVGAGRTFTEDAPTRINPIGGVDSDRDGAPDELENLLGTDPASADSFPNLDITDRARISFDGEVTTIEWDPHPDAVFYDVWKYAGDEAWDIVATGKDTRVQIRGEGIFKVSYRAGPDFGSGLPGQIPGWGTMVLNAEWGATAEDLYANILAEERKRSGRVRMLAAFIMNTVIGVGAVGVRFGPELWGHNRSVLEARRSIVLARGRFSKALKVGYARTRFHLRVLRIRLQNRFRR